MAAFFSLDQDAALSPNVGRMSVQSQWAERKEALLLAFPFTVSLDFTRLSG